MEVSRSSEWIVYDRKKEEFKLVRASTQKEAVLKGTERGVLARHTNHARPRTGDSTLMEVDEFEDWLERKGLI